MKNLLTAALYWIPIDEILFSYAEARYNAWKLNKITELSKKLGRNVDSIFKMIALIFGKIKEKYLSKFM